MKERGLMNQFLHDFGIRILRARRAAGISQEKLGQMVDGVSRHCVWHWEAGFNGCSLERAAKLAKALNVSVGYLFGEVEHEVLDRRARRSSGDPTAATTADAVDKLEGIH
jgi:DNA-binding XRE family transcriptional regulator